MEGSKEQRYAIVDSGADAKSLRRLGFQGGIIFSTGSPSMEILRERFSEINTPLTAAFHMDQVGEAKSAELKRIITANGGRVERLRPVGGKDWNDELRKRIEVQDLVPLDLGKRLCEVECQPRRPVILRKTGRTSKGR